MGKTSLDNLERGLAEQGFNSPRLQMPDHMASEFRDMLIGTKVAGPAKSHLYWSASLLPNFWTIPAN